MTKDEIFKLSQEELIKLLEESRQKLRDLSFDFSFGKTKSIKEIKLLKQQISHILTALNSAKK